MRILICFCGSFAVRYSNFCCDFLSFFFGDFPLVFKIVFIPHQHQLNTRNIGLVVQFFHPIINGLKRLLISDIVNEQHTINVSIVDGCNGSKSLCPSSIPYLYFDERFVIYFYNFLLILDADGGHVTACKFLLNILCEQTAFAHRWLSQDEDFYASRIFHYYLGDV